MINVLDLKLRNSTEILNFIDKNITLIGSQQKKLYIPEEVLSYKEGNLIEITELIRELMRGLGFHTEILYIENDLIKLPTVIFSRGRYWFSIEFLDKTRFGTHGYSSLKHLATTLVKYFKEEYNDPKFVTKLEFHMVYRNDTINSCIERLRGAKQLFNENMTTYSYVE